MTTREAEGGLNDLERLVLYYRFHPIKFAQDIFGVRLIWLQRVSLLALWYCSAVFLFFGRGVGKTYLLALFACMRATLYPKCKIGYYTPTAKQWDVFWDYVDEFYSTCPLFADSIKILKNEKHIKRAKGTCRMIFKNGSIIESLALNEKSRGRRNNIAIFDEYKDHDVQVVNTIGLPFLAVETNLRDKNKQIFATTGFYTWNSSYLKFLFYKLKEMLGDKEYRLLQFDHRDIDVVADSPYRMSKTVREQIRNDPSMTKEKFDMEMYCKIATESDSIFTYRLLDSTKVTPKDDPVEIQLTGDYYRHEGETIESARMRGATPKKYVMGIDNARVANGDNFALQISELDETLRSGKLVYSLALNGVPIPNQAMRIFELVGKFNIVRMYIDNDSYGKAIKDLLALGCEKYGVPRILDIDDKDHRNLNGSHIVKMFNFTIPNIMEMYDKLHSSFEDGRMQLPVDIFHSKDLPTKMVSLEIQRTKRELCTLEIEPRGNGFVYVVPKGKKKDRASAIALANMATVDYYYYDQLTKPKELSAVGRWA